MNTLDECLSCHPRTVEITTKVMKGWQQVANVAQPVFAYWLGVRCADGAITMRYTRLYKSDNWEGERK